MNGGYRYIILLVSYDIAQQNEKIRTTEQDTRYLAHDFGLERTARYVADKAACPHSSKHTLREPDCLATLLTLSLRVEGIGVSSSAYMESLL